MKHTYEIILILICSLVLSSCDESGPVFISSGVLPTLTPVLVATETATKTATITKTATATEVPLFSEAEVEKANPFDDSNWVYRFKTTQVNPEKATEQEWQDEYQFVLAVREKTGIPTTTENKDRNPQLQSLWNVTIWEQSHLDEVKAGKKAAITPLEYRAMIKESKNIGKYGSLPPNDFMGWNYKNIGPILGQDIDAERLPFDYISGKLAGFGTIGGQDVLLIDTEDKYGHEILFPIVVYVEKGPTLPKGLKCIVTNLSYSNRHGGDSTFTLKYDTELGPLIENVTGKVITWEYLYEAFGKEVEITGGGYMPELSRKTGVPETHGFSLGLNLEIASWIWLPHPRK